MSRQKHIEAAMAAHEINRQYCRSLGDDSHLPWDEAPAWQRQSIVQGVVYLVNNPDATPEDSHKSWLEQKEAEGWSFGEKKDPEAKTHPCMVPYEELPQEQRSKDYLFQAAVRLVLGS